MGRVERWTAVIAAASWLAATPARAEDGFWLGDDLTKLLADEDVEALQAVLDNSVRSKLQARSNWFSSYPKTWLETWYPAPLFRGLQYYDQSKTWDGCTLLSVLNGNRRAKLIDMEGNLVRDWPATGIPAKMLPNGHVLVGQQSVFTMSQKIVELEFDDIEGARPVWSFDGFDETDRDAPYFGDAIYGAAQHHDFEREGSSVGYYAPGDRAVPGGKTLFLANFFPDFAETGPAGRNISEHPLTDDAIYEIDRDGRILFQWHAYEHFEQMGFGQAARDAIRKECVAGGVPSCFTPGMDPGAWRTDWTHMNSVSWLGNNRWYNAGDCRFHPDNILWDARSMNLSAIIARHDCGEYKEGDITWRIGPDYGYGTPDHALGTVIGQHEVHMIPLGLPGAGNILIFDNGGFGGFGSLVPGLPGTFPNRFRDTSRVIEVNPVAKQIVWEYSTPLARPGDERPKPFFSTLISGAQRLKNGNTLITEGGTGRVFEVTVAGEIVWEYVSEYEGTTQGGGGYIGTNGVYRAYRVPESWLPAGVRCAPRK